MKQLNTQLIKTLFSSALVIGACGCAHKAPPTSSSDAKVNAGSSQSPIASTDLALVQTELAKAQQDGALDKLDNAITICSINDIPLTMGDYRKSLKEQKDQIQASLAISPEMKAGLLAIAKQRSISLTAAEKAKLIKATQIGQNEGPVAFAKTLKSSNINKSEFQAQVLELGLAFKAAGQIIEERVLRQMIDRELLISAAKGAGFTKQALDEYIKVKQSPEYKKSLTANGITDEDARGKIVANQLCQLMVNQIQSSETVKNEEIKQFYDANKAELKHGPRIRLSQIVIACPEEDSESTTSLRTRLHKTNPKMTDSELAKTVELLENEQRKRAENLLEQAQHGADFVQLANLNTQDATAHKAKNGGDIGFENVSDLSKSLSSKLLALKVGQVCPQLIQSPYGFHIIKVTAKEDAGELSYDECKERIRHLLSDQKEQGSLTTWLDEQLSKAKIRISPEFQAIASSNKSN
jgi:parvulin-like peptidyl-prolyl isomerase